MSAKQQADKASRGEYRSIYVALVDDPDFQDLSAEARSIFFVLKLKLGLSGIGVFMEETLPRYTGIPFERVSEGLSDLTGRGWLKVERNVFWLRNALRFDPSNPLASSNHRKGVENHIKALPKLAIVNEFARYYGLGEPFKIEGDPEGIRKGSERDRNKETPDTGKEIGYKTSSSSTIPVSIDPPTPQDAGIEEEEEVQAIFEMTEAVAVHVEKAPNEAAARRFMAASEGITTGLSAASWRDHAGAQVPWRDRPDLLKLALIKCEAEGGWDSNSLHSALKYTILQQRNPTPTPDFARRRERAADPQKRATFEERIAELEKALPYIRRQSLTPFEGGLPSVDVFFIGPEDYGAWDAVLRKHGLRTIAEMREAAA